MATPPWGKCLQHNKHSWICLGFWLIKALATCSNWVLSVCDIHLPPCEAGIGSDPSFPDPITDIASSLHSFFHPCHPPGCSTSPALFHLQQFFPLPPPIPCISSSLLNVPSPENDLSSECHPQLSLPQLHNTLKVISLCGQGQKFPPSPRDFSCPIYSFSAPSPQRRFL